MGYDSEVVTKTVERYIQEIQLHRDSASATVFEAVGELTAPDVLNDAGQQYHKPESNVAYSFTVADFVAAGENPAEVLALDDQMRKFAERMVAWRKAQDAKK